MLRKVILLCILTIIFSTNNFIQASTLTYEIPDSPEPSGYTFNTWENNQWVEIDVPIDINISNCHISYSWHTDDYPEEASFYVMSPAGVQVTIGSKKTEGTHEVIINDFNSYSIKGKWRFWIEDSYGDGGCQAKNIVLQFGFDKALTIAVYDVFENEGTVQGKLMTNSTFSRDIQIDLVSDNTDAITVVNSVIMPEGFTQTTFDFVVIDDNLPGLSQQVGITAKCFVGPQDLILLIAHQKFNIHDNESGTLMYTIPDSPEADDFSKNTWDNNSWIEMNMPITPPIFNWSIAYTWYTDDYPFEASFHILSPSGTKIIFEAEKSGIKIFSSEKFNGSSIKGKWRFWIEDSYGDGGCQATDISMKICIPMSLFVTIPETAKEATENLTGLVSMIPISNKDLVIHLNKNSSSKLSVEPTTTILAGNKHASFEFSVLDNTLLDGVTPHLITVSSPGYYSGSSIINVWDNEIAALTIKLPEKAIEGIETGQGSVTLDQPVDQDVKIKLNSSHTAVIDVPDTVTIHSGLTTAEFPLIGLYEPASIVKNVTITASVLGWNSDSNIISVEPVQIPEPERQALIDLYHSNNGEQLKSMENWLGIYGSECAWNGIICNNDKTHIIGIDLKNSHLTSLPESIGNFEHLSILNLDGNKLTYLPEHFDDLEKLTDLNLSDNSWPVLSLTFPSLNENDGTVHGKLTMIPSVNRDIQIAMSSSNIDVATVNDSVTMPAGLTQVTIDIALIDDKLANGTKYVTITAKCRASNHDWISSKMNVVIQKELIVYDDESVILFYTIPDSPKLRDPDHSIECNDINTWDNNNWIETYIPIDTPIINWSITYTMTLPLFDVSYIIQSGKFKVMSPSGKLANILYMNSYDMHSDSHIFFANAFKGSSIKGIWRFWIEEYGNRCNEGFQATNITMNITAARWLNVELPEMLIENTKTHTGWVSVFPVPDDNLIVKLAPQFPSDLSVQSNITILAGKEKGIFEFSIKDDSLIDGVTTHCVTATSSGYLTGIGCIKIVDNEKAVLSIEVSDKVDEGVDFFQGLVRLDRQVDRDVNISLHSSHDTVLNVPNTVTIPTGQTSVVFPLTCTYDLSFINPSITITASVMGWNVDSDTISFKTPFMIPESERQVLFDIYNSMTLEGKNLMKNWLGNRGTECTWEGVVCNATETHITEIQLCEKGLASLPENIDHLNQLIFLGIENNNLTSLPESIGHLKQLTHLILSTNNLTNLPDSIGHLNQLKYLDLSNNNLTSLPESIGHLNQLTDLELPDNNLTSLPDSIGQLNQLTELNLSNNNLNSLPDSFENLSEVNLWLSGNNLTSLPERLIFQNTLINLYLIELSFINSIDILSENEGIVQQKLGFNWVFNQDVPISLTSSNPDLFTMVDTLILPEGQNQVSFNCTIVDNNLLNGPEQVTITAKISESEMCNIELDEMHWFLFNNLIIQKKINIIDNETGVLSIELPEKIIEGIKTSQGVVRLDKIPDRDVDVSLQSNHEDVINVPEIVIIQKGMKSAVFPLIGVYAPSMFQSVSITATAMGWNSDSDVIYVEPAMIPDTERQALVDLYQTNNIINYGWLGIRGTECAWDGIDCNDDKTHIIGIDFFSSDIHNLPESFGNLTHLTTLNLESNELNSLPESFGNLNLLTTLNIANNKLNSLPESFGNLNLLTALNLDNNILTRLPENFGDLQQLTILSIVNNNLTYLPDSFGNLKSLSTLNSDSNNLSNLPDSFGNLKHLTKCNLANNNLTTLPQSFGNMKYLTTLSLASNNLISLPETFGNLINLTGLNLYENKLKCLPESFGKLIVFPNLGMNLWPEVNLLVPDGTENDRMIQAELTISHSVNRDIQIALFSSDPDAITVVHTVIMPAGLTQTTCALNVIDDHLLDGSQEVFISAKFFNSYQDWLVSELNFLKKEKVIIHDNDSAILTVDIPEKAIEDNGNLVQGIVRANRSVDRDVIISLYSSNSLILKCPKKIIIYQGEMTAIFPMFIQHSGFQHITITAFVEGWNPGQDTIELIPRIIPEIERQALIDLFNNTGGNNWKKKYNWLNDQGTECTWYGVICTDDRKHIKAILLPSNNLIGQIPESLTNLEQINRLDFSNNHFINLPSNIGHLKNLSRIYISGNQLENLPDSLFDLQYLSELDLSKNHLEKIPDSINNLESLSVLDVSDNHLNSLPESLYQLKFLKILKLSKNNLDKFFFDFKYLSSLASLDLSYNQIRTLSDSIGDLESLLSLDLSYNQLKILPDSIGHLESLLSLDLSYNQISILPDTIESLQYLEEIYLPGNQLNSLPNNFCNLQSLLKVNLSYNNLNSLPENFNNLEKLKTLDLSHNKLSNLPEDLMECQFLTELKLSNNNLSDLPGIFQDLNYLKHLDVSYNQLINFPFDLSSLPELMILNLSNNQINDYLPYGLMEHEKLVFLDLSYNQLDVLEFGYYGGINFDFSRLSSLKYLNLSNNLIEYVPPQNYQSSLTELNISNNNIDFLYVLNCPLIKIINASNNALNSFPSIGNLKRLSKIDLSNNMLESPPDGLTNLKSLSVLNFSYNHLTKIPENIGRLKSLSIMNLSNNQINSLPESLANLNNLSKLDVSNNKLTILPEHFGDIKHLHELDLEKNQLIELPQRFENLINLEQLSLSNNRLCHLPNSFGNLKQLTELTLADNKLKHLPESFYDLHHLEILDLSNNQLAILSENIGNLLNLRFLGLSNNQMDNLPENICNLINLQQLMLDGNELTSIPENIHNLIQLSSLSFANNKVTGNMPKSICHLSNLYSLDLSNNRVNIEDHSVPTLEGDIPVEIIKLKNLSFINLNETGLYSFSSKVEAFILERATYWSNPIPQEEVSSEVKIKYITTSSNQLAYSLNSTIYVLVVMTQPVTLRGGDLIITLDIGGKTHHINIHPFENSVTFTGSYIVQEGDFTRNLNVQFIRFSGAATLRNIKGDDANISLNNLPYVKNIYMDGTIPTISLTYPSQQCVEKLSNIQGTAGDISSDFSVTLTILDTNAQELWNQTKAYYKHSSVNWEFNPPTYIWVSNTSYVLKVEVKDFAGNSNEIIQNITYGKKASTITTNLSENTIILGQTFNISGIILPPESITGEEVTVSLISPSGAVLGRKVNANEDGSFEYGLKCDDIDQAGSWSVVTQWDGTSCLDPAMSESMSFSVNKAPSHVVLDATYNFIKLGDSVSITGKVITEFYCENHMANIPVTIRINGPTGTHEIETKTNDKWGAFIKKNYMGFDSLGSWNIQASVKTRAYKSSFSEMLEINVVETAGYAIIVQGKIAAEEGLDSHNKTANDVYHHLKKRGLLDEDILYFNYDTDQAIYKIEDQTLISLSEDNVPEHIIDTLKDIKNIEYTNEKELVNRLKSLDEQVLHYQSEIIAHSSQHIDIDGLPTKNAIKKAITEDMPKIMRDQPANLYIVMVDHGNEDTFYIDPDTITDDELNDWLTKLEDSPGWDQEIVVMLGFCFSGSFIDNLSKPNRVIISSAGPNEFSYKGPLDQDNIREGEYFISEFFKSVAMGKNVKESFSEAVIQTELFTAKGEVSVNGPPYFDNSAQHPLLDDNGDKVGSNNVMETSKDGDVAENITIGVSALSMNDAGDVILTKVSDAIFIGTDEITTDKIWAKVSDNQRVLSLWLEIKTPDFVPIAVGTGQVEMDLPKIVYSRYDDPTDRYQWDTEDLDNIFDVPGTYHIYYFAKDTDSKNLSPMKESIVYKASPVNHPPEPFDLLYPSNDVEITPLGVLASFSADPTADAYTMISWEDTTDPDNDHLSYTLFFKKDNDHFDDTKNRIKIANLTHSFHEINLPNDWNAATVYWKVQAIDSYGAISESGVNHFRVNNANNPSNGILWGHVYDATTNEPIKMAHVYISAGGKLVQRLISKLQGKYFRAFRPLDNYHIEVQKEGYESIVRSPVKIPKDDRCQQDFYLVPDTSNIPEISEIPSQTVNEGEPFLAIELDNHITDGDNEKFEITWSVSGHSNLNVSIGANRNATITVTDENWNGSETLTFHANDPDGNKVKTSTTFTVKGLNDPPVVLHIPDQIIYDYSSFEPIMLDNYVTDVDNADNEIIWTTEGQRNLVVTIKDRIATISLPYFHWIGYENITFTATDPSGFPGVKTAMFTVQESGFFYDLNHNRIIDLADVVMMLQVFTGIHDKMEWMSDNQIGLDDLLFIMNMISN